MQFYEILIFLLFQDFLIYNYCLTLLSSVYGKFNVM